MGKKLLRVLAALILVCSLVAIPAAVSGHFGDCNHTSLTIFEGLNRTGDWKTICVSLHPDLNNVIHTQSGNCDEHPLGDNSWDDCISSWQVNQNDHSYCIGIYGNPNYVTPLLEGGVRAAGYWSNMDGGSGPGGEENKATSIKWSTSNPCPGNS